MRKEEKCLIGLFAFFAAAVIVHIASDIFQTLSNEDSYIRMDRLSSAVKELILFFMTGSGFVYVANRLDEQEEKIEKIEAKQNLDNVRQNQNNARFFGGIANRLPPPQIVIDHMQVEGQVDQKEGQPRR